MGTAAVRFENVSKRYPRGGGPHYSTLRSDLARLLQRFGPRVAGRWADYLGPLALDDVSFDVNEGEAFALVGPNGAGKTTALQLISRISPPSAGRVTVRGRVAALLQVSSGIHPELTGRENIWLFGRILGMSKQEIASRFEEIVEFSELGHVLDRAVKMYSSGMQMRLGFSIASHIDPDVFLVDEALAVGDAEFRTKCVERMTKLVAEGRTLLFVSHNLSAVEAVCDRGLFLLEGKVQSIGPIKDVIQVYLDWVDTRKKTRLETTHNLAQTRYLTLENVTCHGADGAERYTFETGDPLEVRMRIRTEQPIVRPHFSLGISDGGQRPIILCSMLVDGGAPELVDGTAEISCRIGALPLLPRRYQLWCDVKSEASVGRLLDWNPVASFRVTAAPDLVGPAALAKSFRGPAVWAPHTWAVTTNGRLQPHTNGHREDADEEARRALATGTFSWD